MEKEEEGWVGVCVGGRAGVQTEKGLVRENSTFILASLFSEHQFLKGRICQTCELLSKR